MRSDKNSLAGDTDSSVDASWNNGLLIMMPVKTGILGTTLAGMPRARTSFWKECLAVQLSRQRLSGAGRRCRLQIGNPW
jgi:hypothetical protein